MGCSGCRKSPNRKLSAKKREELRAKAANTLKNRKKAENKMQSLRNKIIKSRLLICQSCPHSVQNKRDKKYNIRICHKVNRPLSSTTNDLSFSCPKGKFKSSS